MKLEEVRTSEEALRLVKRGEVNLEEECGGEPTPLHWACMLCDVDLVMALLNAGADANSHNNIINWSPLHIACLRGDIKIAKILLEHGADVNLVVNDDDLEQTPFLYACANGGKNLLQCLLDAGADPNYKSKMNHTALDVARLWRKPLEEYFDEDDKLVISFLQNILKT